MADPFIAEIRIFPFNFPPKGWALCDGQPVQIGQNDALFSLLGTTYGGDEPSPDGTFALPNLQGSAPIHAGQGPDLSPYGLGEAGGSETVTLTVSQLFEHSHGVLANINPANLAAPSPARSYARSAPGSAYGSYNSRAEVPTPFSDQAIAPVGGVAPHHHNNMQPYLTLNFCIALQGVFPPRPRNTR